MREIDEQPLSDLPVLIWISWTLLTPSPQTVCCRPFIKLPGGQVLNTSAQRAVVGETAQHVMEPLSKIWPVVSARLGMRPGAAARPPRNSNRRSHIWSSNHWRHQTTPRPARSSNRWRHQATRLALRSASTRFASTCLSFRYACVPHCLELQLHYCYVGDYALIEIPCLDWL